MNYLNLSFNKVKDFGMKSLAEALRNNNSLKVLEIERCSI
jgi:hypothetical protein